MAAEVRQLLVTLLLTHLFNSGYFQDASCPSTSTSIRLKKNLLCSYDKFILPTGGVNRTVEAQVILKIRTLEMDEHRNTLIIGGFSEWRWTDHNLKWNPDDWSGLRDVTVNIGEIWSPDVVLISASDIEGLHYKLPNTDCNVASIGNVTCAPRVRYLAHCNPDITQWPFDEQNCTFTIGSWTYFANDLNITLFREGLDVEFILGNNEWRQENASVFLRRFYFGDNVYPSIEYTVFLRRHSAGYAATVVIPAFILATLTLVSFFLDASSSERFILGTVNVLAHCFYLQYLGMKLPANGDTAPYIIIFFRDSLFLVGAGLVLSVLLQFLLRDPPASGKTSTSSTTPPDCLNAAVGWILSWRVGQLLLLSRLDAEGGAASFGQEDGSTLMESEEVTSNPGSSNKSWQHLATLLNRVFFLIFCLVFFVLLIRFVP